MCCRGNSWFCSCGPTTCSSFPGQYNGEMDEDISRLKTTAVSLLSDLGCNASTLTEDLINEMCRYGAAELHTVAAFIGGIASQEVIRIRDFVKEVQNEFLKPGFNSFGLGDCKAPKGLGDIVESIGGSIVESIAGSI